MYFNIIDTYSVYQQLLAEDDIETREKLFRDELVEPFAGLTRVFGGGDPLALFAQWNMKPENFAPEHRETMLARLDALQAANAFDRAAQSLERGWAAFEPYRDRIRHNSIAFGLFLCDLSALPTAGGYSGFGAIPGWIMTLYDIPTSENLKRVEACTVHELHHNLAAGSDSGVNFNMMTITVGEYMVMEGLAESFSAELYGEDSIGPWVTNFDESRLDETWDLFKRDINVTGFNLVSSYIFGDVIATVRGGTPVGAPLYAGYVVGYKLVQAYLKRTGKTVAEATYTPTAEIIAESHFFDM